MEDDLIRARDKLLKRLPITGEIVRAALLERIVHHKSGCPKCARGEGHSASVLTVSYPGGRTRQYSLRGEQVAQVRWWLDNYHELKEALETICELNHQLLRPDRGAPKPGRKKRD
jgi:hypothetical protein